MLFLKLNSQIIAFKNSYFILPEHLVRLYHINFSKSYWRFFKRINNHRYGLLTNNFNKSLIHHSLTALEKLVSSRPSPVRAGFSGLSMVSARYTKPLVVLGFPFQKSLYNTTMFYVLHVLVYNYLGARTQFTLRHGFVIMPDNFNVYMFCNLFYFKLRHY